MEFKVDINEYAEGAVILTGLEDCIIGIVEEFGNGKRLLYDKNKILKKLQESNPMTESDAEEYYEYNILGLYASDQNAVFLDLEINCKMENNELICQIR